MADSSTIAARKPAYSPRDQAEILSTRKGRAGKWLRERRLRGGRSSFAEAPMPSTRSEGLALHRHRRRAEAGPLALRGRCRARRRGERAARGAARSDRRERRARRGWVQQDASVVLQESAGRAALTGCRLFQSRAGVARSSGAGRAASGKRSDGGRGEVCRTEQRFLERGLVSLRPEGGADRGTAPRYPLDLGGGQARFSRARWLSPRQRPG